MNFLQGWDVRQATDDWILVMIQITTPIQEYINRKIYHHRIIRVIEFL